MSQVERNLAANFIGKSLNFVLGIIFLPIYLSVLGIEAYGLITFFVALQGVLNILDLGLTTTITKELARLSDDPNSAIKQRNLTRTIEIVYWLISALTGVIVVLIAPWLANNWIIAQHVSTGALTNILVIMGIATALSFPLSLYYGGLMGLQKQVVLNVFDVSTAIFRQVGAVIIITLFYPTVYAFFVWMAIAAVFQVVIVAFILWHFLPKVNVRARFQKSLFIEILPFATGVATSGVLATILTYSDKIVLSKLVTLDNFAYYGIAGSIGAVSVFAIGPIYAAVFPRMSQLAANKDEQNQRSFYHDCCQFASVMVLPLAVVITLFASEILQVWIRNPTVTSNTHLIASILTVGFALNAIMWMPQGLQWANAWTRLTVVQNTVSVIVLIPLLVVLAVNYGAVGAASVWLALNLGYFSIIPRLVHKRLLKGELKRWYLKDVAYPLVGALSVGVLARIIISFQVLSMQTSVFLLFAELVVIFLSTWMVTIWMVPITRQFFIKNLLIFKNKLSSSI